MNISRRFFIAGAASFGAFGGNRFLNAASFMPTGAPRLRFGVVSDTHVDYDDSDPSAKKRWGSNTIFRKTMQYFRSQNVDAVVIAGDFTNRGGVAELQAVAKAWYEVFPGDRYPDGRPIEKVFVTGNHDSYMTEGVDPAGQMRPDMAGHWREIFHEDYSRCFCKVVKGFPFFGAHWDNGKLAQMKQVWSPSSFTGDLKPLIEANRSKIDPKLPFFYVQHPHPKDTCYGPWAWGHDRGDVTRTLSDFPNAISFSGHSHYSLTDERTLWQGAFTSCGTSSLRYTGQPYNELLPGGYENTETEGKDALKYNAVKLMKGYPTGNCSQGMIWSVYDDCIVVNRREFVYDLELGPDWVLPLPAAEAKPFAFAERAKKVAAPEFPVGAALTVARVKAKTRGGKSRDGKVTIASEEKDAVKLTIPAVEAKDLARGYRFRVEATLGTEVKTKFVLAEGFNHGIAHKRATNPSECVFALDELPKGEVVFKVTPENCFYHPGKPLTAKFAIG